MSKKAKQTPAEVASEIAKFLAKQEETLSRYPVGPLANSAKRNMQRAYQALEALKTQNESMRMQVDPAMQGQQMRTGGEPRFERSLRNFNPGNLRKWGDQPREDGFAVFASPEEGWNALLAQLDRYKTGKTGGTSGDMTLEEAMGKYAPSSDDNNPKEYAKFIAENIGVSPDTPIKDIDTNKWATAITAKEGGDMYAYLQGRDLLEAEVVNALPAVPDATRVEMQAFDEPVFERLRPEQAQSGPAATEALGLYTDLADLSARLNPELARQVQAAREQGLLPSQRQSVIDVDSPEPRPKGTTTTTGYSPTMSDAGFGKGIKIYDIEGNLVGTHSGGSHEAVRNLLLKPDGTTVNMYQTDIKPSRQSGKPAPIYYDKDGNMLGRYQGAGEFSIKDPTAKDDAPLRGAQAMERLRMGQARGARDTAPEAPGVETVQPERVDPLTPRGIPTNNIVPELALTPSQRAELEKATGTKDTEDTGANTRATTPGPQNIDLSLGRMNLLQGIPAATALASAGIQRRALEQFQGPTAPVLADVPAFNYQSNIGQQLRNVADATTAAGRIDGLSGQQQAAMNQALLGQRFRQEQQLQAADNQSRQQARASYDARATQLQAMNNRLRSQYLEDRRVFDNDMATARAAIAQQPLSVMSSAASDYLKNIYYPQQSLALEQVGRQFDTE